VLQAGVYPQLLDTGSLPVWRRWWYGKVRRLASEETTWLEIGPCFRTILPGPTFHLPRGNANLPAGNANLPAGNVNLPAGNVNLPAGNVNLPAGR
jgi:hypothetical protein